MSLIGVYWPFLKDVFGWFLAFENCLRNMHCHSSFYSFTMKHLHVRSRFRTFRDGKMESLHGTLSYKHRDVKQQGGPFFSDWLFGSLFLPGLETSTWNVPTHFQQKLQPFPPASEGHEGIFCHILSLAPHFSRHFLRPCCELLKTLVPHLFCTHRKLHHATRRWLVSPAMISGGKVFMKTCLENRKSKQKHIDIVLILCFCLAYFVGRWNLWIVQPNRTNPETAAWSLSSPTVLQPLPPFENSTFGDGDRRFGDRKRGLKKEVPTKVYPLEN